MAHIVRHFFALNSPSLLLRSAHLSISSRHAILRRLHFWPIARDRCLPGSDGDWITCATIQRPFHQTVIHRFIIFKLGETGWQHIRHGLDVLFLFRRQRSMHFDIPHAVRLNRIFYRLINHPDRRACADLSKQCFNVRRVHANTTRTHTQAHAVRRAGAMNKIFPIPSNK